MIVGVMSDGLIGGWGGTRGGTGISDFRSFVGSVVIGYSICL